MLGVPPDRNLTVSFGSEKSKASSYHEQAHAEK
jgi:hypothetical protein